MRKIISEEERAKKTKRNQIVIGGILVLILLLSTIGYSFLDRGQSNNDNRQDVNYKGTIFYSADNGYWQFSKQGYNFLTRYNAKETENIESNINININDYYNKPLYIVADYQEPLYEIQLNFQNIALRMQQSCFEGEVCNGNLPVKNCSENLIKIINTEENETQNIYQKDNCIFINANFENQTVYFDKALFDILDI